MTQLSCMIDSSQFSLDPSHNLTACSPRRRAPRAAAGDAQGSCHVTCVDASRVVTSRASLGGAGDVSGTQVDLQVVLQAAVPVLTGRGRQLAPA